MKKPLEIPPELLSDEEPKPRFKLVVEIEREPDGWCARIGEGEKFGPTTYDGILGYVENELGFYAFNGVTREQWGT